MASNNSFYHPTFQGNQYKSGEKPNTGSTPTENVNEKTAKKVNVSKYRIMHFNKQHLI